MKRTRFTKTQIISILSEIDPNLSTKELSRYHGFSDDVREVFSIVIDI